MCELSSFWHPTCLKADVLNSIVQESDWAFCGRRHQQTMVNSQTQSSVMEECQKCRRQLWWHSQCSFLIGTNFEPDWWDGGRRIPSFVNQSSGSKQWSTVCVWVLFWFLKICDWCSVSHVPNKTWETTSMWLIHANIQQQTTRVRGQWIKHNSNQCRAEHKAEETKKCDQCSPQEWCQLPTTEWVHSLILMWERWCNRHDGDTENGNSQWTELVLKFF